MAMAALADCCYQYNDFRIGLTKLATTPLPPESGESASKLPDHLRPATFNVPEAWIPVYDWATDLGVAYETFFLIDTALLNEEPTLLGTMLSEISSAAASQFLEDSAESGVAPKLLHRLVHAYNVKKEFPTRFRPYEHRQKAVQQIGEKSERLYLAAAIFPPLPPGDPKLRNWMAKLRTWLLIHGIRRAQVNNFQDKYLKEAASAIRLACEKSEHWRRVLMLLYTPTTECDVLDRWIIFKCEKIRHQDDLSPPLTDTEQKLLLTLSKIARLEPRAIDSINRNLSFPMSSGIRRPEFIDALKAGRVFLWEQTEGDDVNPPHRRRMGSDGVTDIEEVEVDPTASYTHQRLLANSVLIQSTEELQLLPFSWQKPNPFELQDIQVWVSTALGASKPAERFLGAITWISMHTGRSLRRTLDIDISKNISDEWSLPLDAGSLRRRPPMRLSGWTPKTPKEETWIKPIVQMISMALPAEVKSALRCRLDTQPDAPNIGALWNPTWAPSPENAFRQGMIEHLARVTPGMLGAVLPQSVFNHTGDAVFARMVASHPQSALPGACAYASWNLAKVTKCLFEDESSKTTSPPTSLQDVNGLGSRLDPLEPMLIEAIKVAGERLAAFRQTGDVVMFHNAYTAYYVVALLAATGARPIRDPFEARAHFSFDQGFVYIEDKSSSDLRQGRLVPLPRDLTLHFQNTYVNHLSAVAASLQHIAPSISEAIARISSSSTAGEMPYFFFLTGDLNFPWKSVTETTINEQGLFSWPLPLNLFRHRISTRLRQRGCDPEVIDAILGHAEAGCATHGDDSVRAWKKDMTSARPLLEALFDDLGFLLTRGWESSTFISLSSHAGRARSAHAGAQFGIKGRESRRRLRVIVAIRDADREIDVALGDRKLTDLSEDDIYSLSKDLLLQANGMPRTTGYLRYQWLMRRLERDYRETGKKVRLKRRFVRFAESSRFTELASVATALEAKLRNIINDSIISIQPSKATIPLCATAAAILLVLENRITSSLLLMDILRGRNFRLVLFHRQYYLEHAQNLKREDSSAAVRRIKISPFVAALCNRVAGSSYSLTCAEEQPPVELSAIGQELSASSLLKPSHTIKDLIVALGKVIDQVNVMELPGVMAGYLAGRVLSTSLSWSDWLRLEHGKPVLVSSVEETEVMSSPDQADLDEALPVGSALPPLTTLSDEMLQKSSWEFFDTLRKCLLPYKTNLSTDLPLESRRDLLRDIKKIFRAHEFNVSTAVYLLGQWIATLVSRKTSHKEYLALNSIQRYFSALSPAFEKLAANADIYAFDEDEMTEFYTNLLEVRTLEIPLFVKIVVTVFTLPISVLYSLVVPG